MTRESKMRKNGIILSLETFLKERFENEGPEMIFTVARVAAQIKIPEKFQKNKNYKKLHDATLNMIWMMNDIYSFPMEHRNHVHDMNLVTVLMNEKKLNLQEAYDESGKMYEKLMENFKKYKKLFLIEYQNADEIIEFYESLLIGQIDWYASSRRYHENENFKENHLVEIVGEI